MKTEQEIKYLLKLLDKSNGEIVWKKIKFTPYSYTDVERTLKWVLKSK